MEMTSAYVTAVCHFKDEEEMQQWINEQRPKLVRISYTMQMKDPITKEKYLYAHLCIQYDLNIPMYLT